jgi:hypothetical protein
MHRMEQENKEVSGDEESDIDDEVAEGAEEAETNGLEEDK